MDPVESTREVLAWKVLNLDIDEKWSDWAAEMLVAGFETEHLAILAGIEKPYNQFELQDLVNRVFDELSLYSSNRDEILYDYVDFLVDQFLDGKREAYKVLEVLKDICIELNYDLDLYDFYSLFFAKQDLEYDEVSWHWYGANRSNIDQLILECFKDYKYNRTAG